MADNFNGDFPSDFYFDEQMERRGKRNPPARVVPIHLKDRMACESGEWDTMCEQLLFHPDREQLIDTWLAFALGAFNGGDEELSKFIHFCFYLLSMARVHLKVDGDDGFHKTERR